MAPDLVNHPPHYSGKVECIDAIESATADLVGQEAFCTANAIKYLWRWNKKNGVQDLEKAKWYINRIIQTRLAATPPRPTRPDGPAALSKP